MNQVLPMKRISERAMTQKPKRAAPPARTRIVSQLWRMAEKQVEQVEARLDTLSDQPQALEREAKTLSIIARTVRDLLAIDQEKSLAKSGGKANEDGKPEPSRAIEDFRRELAEKLEQLRNERAGSFAAGETLPGRD